MDMTQQMPTYLSYNFPIEPLQSLELVSAVLLLMGAITSRVVPWGLLEISWMGPHPTKLYAAQKELLFSLNMPLAYRVPTPLR